MKTVTRVKCRTKEQICHAGNSLPVWAGAVGKFELHMLSARRDPNSYPKSQHTIPAMQSRNHVARGLMYFFFGMGEERGRIGQWTCCVIFLVKYCVCMSRLKLSRCHLQYLWLVARCMITQTNSIQKWELAGIIGRKTRVGAEMAPVDRGRVKRVYLPVAIRKGLWVTTSALKS